MSGLTLLTLLTACDLDPDWGRSSPYDEETNECLLEVLNCDEELYLVYLDGENIGTLAEGDPIETVPGIESIHECDDFEFEGTRHNLDIRRTANTPHASVNFQYSVCSSIVISGGELHVDCEHVYCSFWSE